MSHGAPEKDALLWERHLVPRAATAARAGISNLSGSQLAKG